MGLTLACPIPIAEYPQILMAHGGGGTLMHDLLERVILPILSSGGADAGHDAALMAPVSCRTALTTDSYVVRPLVFPGGDIGSLAVHGTVNDLAMAGAAARYLSVGLILEEGLATETLVRVLRSMRRSADAAGVRIITGDTKVVDHGKGDGIFINTAGVGILEHDRVIHPSQVRAGDAVLVSGDLGRHGIAIMASREGLQFETPIESDSAALGGVVQNLLDTRVAVHCLRDLTRGGLASALNEIAASAGVRIHLDESEIPLSQAVAGACEMLGLDPLYVACEGRFVALVPSDQAAEALALLRAHPLAKDARIIGQVQPARRPDVTLLSRIGAVRRVDMLSGEQLPRIC